VTATPTRHKGGDYMPKYPDRAPAYLPPEHLGGRWQMFGLCRNYDPATFFPEAPRMGITPDYSEASAICERCPVRPACVREALNLAPDVAGVWGGFYWSSSQSTVRKTAVKARAWLASQPHLPKVVGVGAIKKSGLRG